MKPTLLILLTEADNTTLLKSLIGLIGTVATLFFVNFVVEKIKAKKEIKIAEINKDSENNSVTLEELKQALTSIKELEQELKQEREAKAEAEKQHRIELNNQKAHNLKMTERLNSIKVILRIVMKNLQSSAEFKNNPDKLATLRDLQDYIDS